MYKHKLTGYLAKETHSGKNYRVEHPKNFTIPKWIVEDSEEWEKVEGEEGYTIISFRRTKSQGTEGEIFNYEIGDYNYWKNAFLARLDINEIYSVSRNSDGEIFTIGDFVEYSIDGQWEKEYVSRISGFSIEDDRLVIDTIRIKKWAYLSDTVRKVKKTKLFTTTDGKDIYEGDDFWLIDASSSNYKIKYWENKVMESCSSNNTYLENKLKFSTKEKAEEYILYARPFISLNDLFYGTSGDYITLKKENLIEVAKSKL